MNFNKLINCCCLILVFSLISFAQDSAGESGQAQNNSEPKIYQNYLYKFSFEIPKGWTEISSDDSKIFVELGKTMLKPNEKGRKEVDKSVERTQILLNTTKYTPGMPDNASLICAVEAASTPKATIEQSVMATQLSFQKNFGYTITSSAKKVTLGNRSFYSIKMSKVIEPGMKIYQFIYLQKIGDKILQFVGSHTKPEDGELLEKSLQTLKFSK